MDGEREGRGGRRADRRTRRERAGVEFGRVIQRELRHSCGPFSFNRCACAVGVETRVERNIT
eukprot:1914064-Rhodomonas_salina.1